LVSGNLAHDNSSNQTKILVLRMALILANEKFLSYFTYRQINFVQSPCSKSFEDGEGEINSTMKNYQLGHFRNTKI
jgi:hypothetical protein